MTVATQQQRNKRMDGEKYTRESSMQRKMDIVCAFVVCHPIGGLMRASVSANGHCAVHNRRSTPTDGSEMKHIDDAATDRRYRDVTQYSKFRCIGSE